MHRVAASVCCWILLVAPALAQPDGYPKRNVRIVVPFTPAGASDMLARMLSETLSQRLNAKFIVDNRPGSGANLGGEIVARAAPDGYTLLLAPSTVYAAGTTVYPKRSFDLARDFTAIATIAYVPHVLVIAPDVQAKSVEEFVKLAKARKDGFNMASQGVGTISHLEGEWFQTMTQLQFVHVPYKGSAPAHLDIIGGRVQVMFDSVAAALPQIRAGKLKPIAVTTPKRVPALNEVPTFLESGMKDYVAESWLGLLAPAKLPAAIRDKLHAELAALSKDARFSKTLLDNGFEARVLGPAEYDALMRSETAHWAAIVKRAGISLE